MSEKKPRQSMRRYALSAGILLAVSAGSANAEDPSFSYNGDTGPAHWSTLNPDWETCAGTSSRAAQSPIDINRVRVDRSLKRLRLRSYPTSIDTFNNGHTIEQSYEGTGSGIYFEGVDYELQQFHFHTLSEHTVGGRHLPLEMHAVFSEPNGAILVVSQMFRIGHHKNRFLSRLIKAGLPVFDGDTTETDMMINLRDGLTNTSAYYTYNGSLTTPPCSEVVTWVVLKQQASMTRRQYESFRQILGNNFRPLQKINGRKIRATKRSRQYGHR